jgi:hypothetical protein
MLLERAQMLTLAEEENGDEVVLVAGRINRRLAIPAPSGLAPAAGSGSRLGGAASQGR